MVKKYEVKLEESFLEEVAVIKKGVEAECSICGNASDIVSFGLVSKYDAYHHVDETFFWCPCGHKWIEEPTTCINCEEEYYGEFCVCEEAHDYYVRIKV